VSLWHSMFRQTHHFAALGGHPTYRHQVWQLIGMRSSAAKVPLSRTRQLREKALSGAQNDG
jgi:hypothetical protein